MKTKFYAVAHVLLAWLARLIFAVVPHGKKNEPKLSEGPYIVCANHISAIDPICICAVLSRQQPNYMAKKELFDIPVLRLILKSIGVFPVDRSGKNAGVVLKTVSMLESGRCIGLFPQGTRRPGVNPAETSVRNGIGFICAKSKAQVLPVYIHTRGNKYRFLKPIHVYVGKPIPYDEYTENGQFANDFNHISQYVFAKSCELSPLVKKDE